MIRGNHFYRGGSSPGIFRDGAVHNIATFHAGIQEGDYRNPTVPPSVRSILVTVLGRTAAYQGDVVYWDKLLASGQKLDAGLKGLKE